MLASMGPVVRLVTVGASMPAKAYFGIGRDRRRQHPPGSIIFGVVYRPEGSVDGFGNGYISLLALMRWPRCGAAWHLPPLVENGSFVRGCKEH
jgi:hypothetical protein